MSDTLIDFRGFTIEIVWRKEIENRRVYSYGIAAKKQSTIKTLEIMTEKELAKEVLKGHVLIDPCPTPWNMLKIISKALGRKK